MLQLDDYPHTVCFANKQQENPIQNITFCDPPALVQNIQANVSPKTKLPPGRPAKNLKDYEREEKQAKISGDIKKLNRIKNNKASNMHRMKKSSRNRQRLIFLNNEIKKHDTLKKQLKYEKTEISALRVEVKELIERNLVENTI